MPKADLKEILHLLDNLDNGTLSEEGRQTLETWGDESPGNRALIEEGLSIELIRGKMNEMIRQVVIDNKEELWRKIELQRQRQSAPSLPNPPQATKSRKPATMRPIAAAAVAAAVLLLIGAIWYWTTPGRTNKESIAVNTGPTRPTITYKNKVIYIDSLPEEDTVLRIGNWTITKNDKKHIVYTMTNPPPGAEVNPTNIPQTVISIPYDKDTTGWQISFADGTRSVLYSGYLSLPLKDSAGKPSQRDVALQGNAYFDVSHNANDPFKTTLPGGKTVDAIGTFFGINTGKQQTADSIQLFNGKLYIKNQGNTIDLHAGQMALLDRSSAKIDTMKVLRYRDSLPWKKDKFDFSDQPFSVAMERVRKWYSYTSVVYDPDIDTDRIGRLSGGRIDKDLPLEKLLKMIEDNTTGIQFQIKNRIIYVETKK